VRGYETKDEKSFRDALRTRPAPELSCPECGNKDVLVGEKSAAGATVQRWFDCPDCGYEAPSRIIYGAERCLSGRCSSGQERVARFDWVGPPMRLEILDRHSAALFEFLWCPVCGQAVVTHIPFEGVCCTNCHT
jgi:predicted RNA-binding Zn-ribbon protein involved in translation (DUF1610 family)